MDLNCRDGNRLQRIQNGHGGVGVGSGIDHNAVHLPVGPLNLIHQISLMVGLVLFDFHSFLPGGVIQKLQKIRKGVFSVNTRFPDAEHVQIGAVDDQNFHEFPSQWARIALRVSSGLPLLSTE